MDKFKRKSHINLYSPGIVIFDPLVLNAFLIEKDYIGNNIFEYFINNEDVGQESIKNGIILPLYPIVEHDYYIHIESEKNHPELIEDFFYSGFPLTVKSDLLITADLNALFDWDPNFFLHYRANYHSKLENNDYLDVKPGIYSANIRGGRSDSKNETTYIYKIELIESYELPLLASETTIESFNFNLIHEN
ncbi:hypothetical protein [Pseudomonas luteola]|uniref:hypothetical protein n=1 Tax=Pseudomonas luteola TaxID=47886 RepID=UPI001238CE68|nr:MULTISPECIES: hypothetical protein [Pseudomonas]MBA1246435.1 hypothetical protein [Pseudomonas zeshuii]QEU27126.1 hypothetical protein FOB45_04820 [Pseudomonas luteola]